MTKVVTFYSYKGGVGRTMALVNTAFVLAKKGWRVLMADFDLEAPGMTHFFSGMLPHSQKMPKHDAIDLLLHAKRDLEKAQGNPGVPRPPRSLADYVVNIALPDEWLERIDRLIPYRNGRVDLIPATLEALTRGQETLESGPSHDYVKRIDELDLPGLFSETGPGHQFGYHVHQFFLDARFKTAGDILFTMRKQVHGAYDIVLLDSRTGLNEISGLCIGPMSDALVVCCGLNRQNVQGVRYFMDKAGLFDKEKAKPYWVIAGPVPPWRTVESKARVQEMGEALRTETIFEVPYHPAAAISETIFVLTEPGEAISETYQVFGSRLAEELSPPPPPKYRTGHDFSLHPEEVEFWRILAEEDEQKSMRRCANLLTEMHRSGQNFRYIFGEKTGIPTANTLIALPRRDEIVEQERLLKELPLAAAVSAYRLQSDRPFRLAWKLLPVLDDTNARHRVAVGLTYFQLRVLGSLPEKELVGKAFDVLTREADRKSLQLLSKEDQILRIDALATAIYIDGYGKVWRVFGRTDATCEALSGLLGAESGLVFGNFANLTPWAWASWYPQLILATSKATFDDKHREILTKAIKKIRIFDGFHQWFFPANGNEGLSRNILTQNISLRVNLGLGETFGGTRPLLNIPSLMVSATALVKGPKGIKDILDWVALARLAYGYAWRVMVDWRHLECVKNEPSFVAFLQQEDEMVNEIESAIDKGVYAL